MYHNGMNQPDTVYSHKTTQGRIHVLARDMSHDGMSQPDAVYPHKTTQSRIHV